VWAPTMLLSNAKLHIKSWDANSVSTEEVVSLDDDVANNNADIVKVGFCFLILF